MLQRPFPEGIRAHAKRPVENPLDKKAPCQVRLTFHGRWLLVCSQHQGGLVQDASGAVALPQHDIRRKLQITTQWLLQPQTPHPEVHLSGSSHETATSGSLADVHGHGPWAFQRTACEPARRQKQPARRLSRFPGCFWSLAWLFCFWLFLFLWFSWSIFGASFAFFFSTSFYPSFSGFALVVRGNHNTANTRHPPQEVPVCVSPPKFQAHLEGNRSKARGPWTFWKALPNEDLSSLS